MELGTLRVGLPLQSNGSGKCDSWGERKEELSVQSRSEARKCGEGKKDWEDRRGPYIDSTSDS